MNAPANAIRNPANPDHFMVIEPVAARVRAYHGDTLVAETTRARRVMETAGKAYDPMLYIPASDIAATLTQVDKSTRCPLKGQASYYAFDGEEIAWSYTEPFDFSGALADHFAFWPAKVRVEVG